MTRWCTWHGAEAEATVLARVVEVGSGPGGMFYACPSCVEAYGITPLTLAPEASERPLCSARGPM
ncbi:hypothetical protein ACH429_06130 [Streptomyces pathocidini]|uniref:Uncharacterized protein n=1 Tax=Streptomyces pathocidini TaxID=1650571 RepID=A0ABW7UPB8_9ACTN|nr:hypothetical protein [Streptomyces pathocidini]